MNARHRALRLPLAALLLATLGAAALPAQSLAPAESGSARAERLLAAMGGREAWAKVRWVKVEAVHDDLNIEQPYTNRIWNDFAQPRVRFEARNAKLDRRRAITDTTGWRIRDGQRADLKPEEVADERKWWEANIYRTLQRLAKNDPDLEPRAVGAHRLEIFRRGDGKRLNWFLLHPSGAPMLFSTWESEAASAMGPLAKAGALKFPKWGARPDGSWRYEIVRFSSGEDAPPEAWFTADEAEAK